MSDQETPIPTQNVIPSTPPEVSPSDPSDQTSDIDWGDLIGMAPEGASEPAPPAPPVAAEPQQQVAPQPQPASPYPAPVEEPVVVPFQAPPAAPQQPQPAAAPPAQPAQPVQAPVAAEPPVQPQPQVMEPPPQVAPQPAPAPTAQPAQPAADVAQAYAQQREQWLSHLERAYTPDQEAIELLQSEPEKALPKALAQVHARAAEETSQYVLGQVHQLVGAAVKQQLEVMRHEAQFYRSWPQLRNPAYAQTVSTVGYAFRQMNPQATPEQFIQQVGAQASVALGLPIGQQAGARPQAAPAAQPAPSPQAVQQQFRPTGPSYQPAPSGVAAPPTAAPQLVGVEKDLAELWEDFEANGWS